MEERNELLAEYAEGPKRVRDYLASVPKEAITYRPQLEGAWTMAEHAQHLFDAEVLAYVRYRTAIVSPGLPTNDWDQEGWNTKLGYGNHDLSTALEGFSLIRSIVHRHLSLIIEDDWTRFSFVHPKLGPLDLDGWLAAYVRHVQTHIDYFDRNLRAFNGKP